MAKKLRVLLRAVISLAAWSVGVYVLNYFEYFMAFGDIDNIAGIIPVSLAFTSAAGISVLLWVKHIKRYKSISISIAALIILAVALFPLALRGNWWIKPITPNESEAAPDLTIYATFSEKSWLAKLNEPSELRLTSELPVLDGATALYPVYAAFAQAVYAEDFFRMTWSIVQIPAAHMKR